MGRNKTKQKQVQVKTARKFWAKVTSHPIKGDKLKLRDYTYAGKRKAFNIDKFRANLNPSVHPGLQIPVEEHEPINRALSRFKKPKTTPGTTPYQLRGRRGRIMH